MGDKLRFAWRILETSNVQQAVSEKADMETQLGISQNTLDIGDSSDCHKDKVFADKVPVRNKFDVLSEDCFILFVG